VIATPPPTDSPLVALSSVVEEHPVFGKPLRDSLKYASVQISTADANGNLYVWGYIPVVVAKWSVALVLGYTLVSDITTVASI
jgi:hypothetical protein